MHFHCFSPNNLNLTINSLGAGLCPCFHNSLFVPVDNSGGNSVSDRFVRRATNRLESKNSSWLREDAKGTTTQ